MTVENITIRDPHSGTTARVLTGLGSNLYSLCVPIGDREVDLLWAAEDFGRGTERPSGSGIPILFPFPGRIAGTGFEWEEKSYALEAGDAFGNAIHGFVYNRPWRVTAQTESSLTTQFQASVDDATILERWPADFKITMVYELHDRTLELRCTVENPDSRPLPFGLGFHPYFRLPLLGGHADECTVSLPVSRRWELRDMLPTGEISAVTNAADLQSGIAFRDMRFDDVFTGLIGRDGKCAAVIHEPSTGTRVDLAFDSQFRECVVYTPGHRGAVCVEPYTCVPNAINLQPTKDTGLRVLERGGVFATWLRIRVV